MSTKKGSTAAKSKANGSTRTDLKSTTKTPTAELKHDPVAAATSSVKSSDPPKKHQKSGTDKGRKDRKV